MGGVGLEVVCQSVRRVSLLISVISAYEIQIILCNLQVTNRRSPFAYRLPLPPTKVLNMLHLHLHLPWYIVFNVADLTTWLAHQL